MRFWAVIKQNTRANGVEIHNSRDAAIEAASAKAGERPGEVYIVFESVDLVHVPPTKAVVEEIAP